MRGLDKAEFWRVYRSHFGPVRSSRIVEELEGLLDQPHRTEDPSMDVAQLAYVLATVKHETAGTYRPVREYGRGKGRRYGKPCPLMGRRIVIYYGRGYVQLTWLENYARMSARLNLGSLLVVDPDSALNPGTAWRIAVVGMMDGYFHPKGKGLWEYVTKQRQDFYNARRTVNGTDKAREIAQVAKGFLDCLRKSIWYE